MRDVGVGRQQGRGRWLDDVGARAAVVLAALVLVALVAAPAAAPDATTGDDLDVLSQSELELVQLREEIRALVRSNRPAGLADHLVDMVPLATAGVAVAGVLLAVWKHTGETTRQRRLDHLEREREALKRFDDRLAATVDNLGSDSPAHRASAAITLLTFLHDDYRERLEEVFLVVTANLKLHCGHEPPVTDLMVRAVERILPAYLESAGHSTGEAPMLDLARCHLVRARLGGLTALPPVDIAFSDLEGADLTGTRLWRVRGYGADLSRARLSRADLIEARLQAITARRAQFHETDLVAADLKYADLRECQFQRARLQSAHLEHAMLAGARFEGADLNDAYFFEATGLTGDTLRSIVRARNWERAHFDEAVLAGLYEAAGRPPPAGELEPAPEGSGASASRTLALPPGVQDAAPPY